jgi:IS30 family transposase
VVEMIKTYGMSVEEQDQVWQDWRAGVSLSKIGISLGRPHQHVLRYLKSYDGVRTEPCARPQKQLWASEREEISRGLAVGDSYRVIGNRLGRAHKIISREVYRNGGPTSDRATLADEAAGRRRSRPKRSKLAGNLRLRRRVEEWLKDDWSPEQISDRLRLDYPLDHKMRVSHECIYLSIFQPHIKAFKREMHVYLRSKRTLRDPKRPNTKTGRGRLRNMVPIQKRPVEAESRDVLGHLEGDLVMGRRPSAVATLVDRKTRQIKVVALTGIKAEPVKDALANHLGALPPHARQTLTWDRGREMAQHQELTRQTGCQVYFCDPQSPWQRGKNENANRYVWWV